jgi:hypothetical protein
MKKLPPLTPRNAARIHDEEHEMHEFLQAWFSDRDVSSRRERLPVDVGPTSWPRGGHPTKVQ